MGDVRDRILRVLFGAAFGLALSGGMHGATAQRSTAPLQSVAPAVFLVDFGPDDPETPGYFDFSATAPGIVLARPGFVVSAFRGVSDATLADRPAQYELVDIALHGYGGVHPFGDTRIAGFDFFVPIGAASVYRRITVEQDRSTLSVFEYTSLGLEAGAGVRGGRSGWRVEARATPSIGFASRAFGNSTGRLIGFDSDVAVHLGPYFGRMGIALGWGYSWQRWRVGGPDAVAIAGSGRFNYTGQSHSFRVGISW